MVAGFWKKALGLAVLAASVVGSMCHGFLAEPKARNVVHNSNYCPHCLAAGGPGSTYAGGRVWPNALHGVCGDAHDGARDHEAGGKFATKKITATYVQGQTVTLRVKITAPHGGRFSFGLCPVPDKASDAEERALVTQACFDRNQLTAAGSPYWWFGKKPTGEYTMDFKLPPGVTCKRCVLQWHYETGNSCAIPGTPAKHAMSANMVSCDKTGVMEEFWNCADVSIKAGDGAGPPPDKGRKTKRPGREAYAEYGGALLPTRGAAHDPRYLLLAAGLPVLAITAMPLALAVAAAVAMLVFLLAQHAIGPAGRRRRPPGSSA